MFPLKPNIYFRCLISISSNTFASIAEFSITAYSVVNYFNIMYQYQVISFSSSSLFFNTHQRIRSLILRTGKEREKHQCERNTDRLLPYVPQLGIEPATFWCVRQRSNQLSHPGRPHPHNFRNTGWYKSRFTVVSTQKQFLFVLFFITALFSI